MADKECTISMTKGCFLFNLKRKSDDSAPSPHRKRKKAKTKSRNQDIDSSSGFEVGQESTHLSERLVLYKKAEKKFFKSIKRKQKKENEAFLSELVEFVMSRASAMGDTKVIHKLACAALLKGVNVPDHNDLFDQLSSMLHSYDTKPLVASIQAHECPNVAGLMKSILEKLTLTQGMTSPSSISKFVDLYMELSQEEYSGGKVESSQREYSMKGLKPVVIIMKDVESFKSEVLRDFLLILGNYTTKVPWVVIFGVATTVNALYACLPHKVSSRLAIRMFQPRPSLECLNDIINEHLISSKHAFKLGPKVLHILYENFLCHDLSIHNFLKGFKLCLMDHFYSASASMLCTNKMETLITRLKDLSEEESLELQDIPSVKRHIEKKPQAEQQLLLNNASKWQNAAKELLINVVTHEARFYPVLNCLHLLSSKLPKSPLGKRLLDTLQLCLEKHVSKSSEYSQAMDLLTVLSGDQFTPLLLEFKDILNNASKSNSHCSAFVGRLEDLNGFITKTEEISKTQVEVEGQSKVADCKVNAKIYKNRFELQEKMRNAVLDKKRTPYQKLRLEIVAYLNDFFREYLVCPMSLPFHEVFYYDDATAVRENIIGRPRSAVQTALTHPHRYLECPCCAIEDGVIQDTLPDISILYKLHLECGRLINLYDWLQAFVTVVDPSLSTTRKPTAKQKREMEMLQARFIRGVSELQFLGFIKSTKRKTDHVSRLTFGNC